MTAEREPNKLYEDIITEQNNIINQLREKLEEYELLLFQPFGDTHHDAMRCPYCRENLNGKS